MVSLFLTRHDHYFMFKDLNVFKFTNFPFKTKYNNTVVYSVNSNKAGLFEGSFFWEGVNLTPFIF